MLNMKTILFSLLVSLVMFYSVGSAQTSDFAIGAKLENFTLSDTNGKTQTFEALKGQKGTVLVWLSAQCPVVKLYNERISAIAEEFKSKGINFIGINSNATEGIDWVRSNAEANYRFPVLIDKDNVLADKLGATVTPETYFFDSGAKLLYHGAIDNDRSGRNIQENYLRNAFTNALEGRAIERTRANAFGCTIKRTGM